MIYCDLDGVLANFRKSASAIIGLDIDTDVFDDLGQGMRNKKFSEACDNLQFWTSLEPMPDYAELWGYLRYFDPFILTAYPMWSKEAGPIAIKGKHLWNRAHMMIPEHKFLCVERPHKQKYALNSNTFQPNVLIDDKGKNINEWTAAGGIGILHTNAEKTIERLIELGYRK